MIKNTYFMVGPTAIPERVLHAMNKQIISHRSQEFYEIFQRLTNNLKKLFHTENDVLVLTCSGTGAMEAVIQNCFTAGDHVVVPVMGEFSERYAIMGEKYGLNVTRVNFELGETADVEEVMKHVNSETKGVLVVHNESATGVFSDIEAFGEALKDTEALLISDSVSGMGGLELKMDEWNVDVVLTSSQKALMSPPGLGFVSLSDKAWKVVNQNKNPNFYFDLVEAKKFHQLNQTPWTPAVISIIGADEALTMIIEEGLENVYRRHITNSEMVRTGVEKLGFKMFPKDLRFASPTVNTIAAPKKAKYIVNQLKEYGVIVSGGQGILGEDTFRVGTMGYVSETDISVLLYALGKIVKA